MIGNGMVSPEIGKFVTARAVWAPHRASDGTFADENSYFHRYAALSEEQARETAVGIWDSINEPNLIDNVLTTRGRATLVLSKDADHSVRRIRLRKL